MRRSSLFILGTTFAIAAAIATACGSSTTESTACDPLTDPSCTANGDETGTGGETGGDYDSSVPTAEVGGSGMYPPGSTVLPDGAVVLPDGAIVGPGSLTGCTPGSTQCTNCVDDDKDGFIDWLDPECTGPLDNDESSYATGIPGDNIDPCKQDCWFDGNSGSGNDGCLFDLRCSKATANAACPYDPSLSAKECAPPSTKCIDYCKPLTPKGCDCDGCCQVYDPTGAVHTVKLVAGCDVAHLSDPTKCPVCTQVPSCLNPCGKCDFCLGKTSVPPECYPSTTDAGTGEAGTTDGGTTVPPTPTTPCPTGSTVCDPSHPCPTGEYCLTGCCIKPPA